MKFEVNSYIDAFKLRKIYYFKAIFSAFVSGVDESVVSFQSAGNSGKFILIFQEMKTKAEVNKLAIYRSIKEDLSLLVSGLKTLEKVY